MNHIFASYIGVFMDVYLDDIVIYSDSIEDHVKHIRTVLEVLRREKLYLSTEKMEFFAEKLKILGHVVDEKGISMDPNKVNTVVNWKVPTNKGLLSSFLGGVSYLAGNCRNIRIPMGVLHARTGATKLWKWGATEQRAFEQIKRDVDEHRHIHRGAIDYSNNAKPVNLVTDACLTGASGVISQGDNLETAQIISFWSGKFNSAQQNYPVHEQELLAIVESLKRFRPQLLGIKFRICTDHKSLEYIMQQKHLSPRQHRWIDVLNEFDFTIHYIPGETNKLADALSRIYSDEPEGIVRAESEYVSEDSPDEEEDEARRRGTTMMLLNNMSSPLHTGLPTLAAIEMLRRSSRIAKKQDKPENGKAKDLSEEKQSRGKRNKHTLRTKLCCL